MSRQETTHGRKIVVNEIFGPTIQGEGPSMGRICSFVRLGGCNLTCTWCDTPYTWDWTGQSNEGTAYDPKAELHAMHVVDVADRLRAMDVRLVVISGGEPLQQQQTVTLLCHMLKESGVSVEIETNGTIAPSPALTATQARFNVSPKLRHSGMGPERTVVPVALRALNATGGAAFKFVCRGPADLEEVDAIVARHGLESVWIMPEGQDQETLTRHMSSLADAVVARRWNMSTRIHVQAWGNRRGV
ncbi:radical SAM protein [Streptomyces rimosus]|uniref:7-carboxy-7-deazaguanine synthase QueE n=1 Tax=Streptomyces TaxID=1883 RepID=UPI000519A45F|nr:MULTISPECIES: radical SAM protein [Streptomyces]RSO34178.1 radical SAM protein [Streptomyces sp. WAC 06725]